MLASRSTRSEPWLQVRVRDISDRMLQSRSGSDLIRVAQVVGGMHGGGVESVIMNYYRHIDRERVQFDFIVGEDSSRIPFKEIESLGGRVFTVPSKKNIVVYMRVLKGLFQNQQWSIVHSHVNALSVFSLKAAKEAGVPIRIAHSHSSFGKGELLRNSAKSILRSFSRVYPTDLMACGERAGRWLFGDDAQFDILRNAIELDRFSFDVARRERMRHSLGLSEDAFVLGHVGRFVTTKNHGFLIDIFQCVKEALPDAKLLLVGEGPLFADVKAKVDALCLEGDVLFLGQRDDADELYQAFDCFVLPSLYEGFCVVGVEAQAAALPCAVSSRVSDEVALTDGIRFLSIDDAPRVWADEIVKMRSEHRALTPEERAALAPYNIAEAAVDLQRYYEGLNARVSSAA